MNELRRKHAELYCSLLKEVANEIQFPSITKDTKPVYHVFVVQLMKQTRARLIEHLGKAGIKTGIHYPIPIHSQPAFKEYKAQLKYLKNTETVSERIVSLPMFAGLKEIEINYVAKSIKEFLKR